MEEYERLSVLAAEDGGIEALVSAILNPESCIFSIDAQDRWDVESRLGQTLLHCLCKKWNTSAQNDDGESLYVAVERLVNSGVDVRVRDRSNGYLALHYAVLNNLGPKTTCFLLAKDPDGASSTCEGLDGETPLDYLSTKLRSKHVEAKQHRHGGSVVTFGRSDLQLGYTTEQNVQATAKRVKFLKYHGNDLAFVAAAR